MSWEERSSEREEQKHKVRTRLLNINTFVYLPGFCPGGGEGERKEDRVQV